MSRAERCPCHSGAHYLACCAPFHRGAREAETPTLLMRSRYAAFARGEVDYLWRTLHASHADRERPEGLVRQSIRESAQSRRYMGLEILDAEGTDPLSVARVLFYARVFQKGRDQSFTECSEFRHDELGWRYCGGALHPGAPTAKTVAAFLSAMPPR